MAIYVALIGTMLVEARRLFPLWAAFLVTLLVARIFVLLPPFEAFQALIFVWCVEALADRIRLPTLALAAIGGVLAGAAVLGKVNVGIFVVAMVGVTIVTIGRPWGRSILSTWLRRSQARSPSGWPPDNTSQTLERTRAGSTRSSPATAPRWAPISRRRGDGSTSQCRPWARS